MAGNDAILQHHVVMMICEAKECDPTRIFMNIRVKDNMTYSELEPNTLIIYLKGGTMTIIRFLIFPLTFLLMYSAAAYAGDNFKIGVVDFQQVLQQSKSGQEIQNQIKQEGEALTSEIQRKQDEIKIMQEKYKRESLVLSNEQKAQKERELRDQINAYRMLQNQNNQKFNKLRSELINDAQKTIVDLAEQLGKSQGYLLIIEKKSGTVLYAGDALEITDQFVEQFDKQDTAKEN